MRIRTIKPEFFKHDDLAEFPALSRLLFIGLWCMADSEGRIEDRPKRIKAEVLPYDVCDTDAMLNDLQSGGFIQRYEAEGLCVIQVVNFEKHQRITGKEAETPSKLPAFPRDIPGESTVNQRGNSGETTETTGREGKGKESNIPPNPPEGGGADAPDEVPFSDPLDPEPHPDELPPEDSKRIETVDPESSAPLRRPARSRRGLQPAPKNTRQAYPAEFEALWQAHIGPRKGVHKAESCKLYKAALAGGVSHEEIMAGHARYLASEQWQKDDHQYVEALDVWLRNSRWEDHPTAASPKLTTLDGGMAPGVPAWVAGQPWESVYRRWKFPPGSDRPASDTAVAANSAHCWGLDYSQATEECKRVGLEALMPRLWEARRKEAQFG